MDSEAVAEKGYVVLSVRFSLDEMAAIRICAAKAKYRNVTTFIRDLLKEHSNFDAELAALTDKAESNNQEFGRYTEDPDR